MIYVNKHAQGQKYTPFWRTCVGAGRGNEILRAAFQRHLQLVQEQLGFRYIRFHGLLHDDMFVMRKDDSGQYVFNFQYIDEAFDTLLQHHIRPFVELSFFPECLKGGSATQFWWKANITPPEDYATWDLLVDTLIRHWIARYGLDEVRAWYFEVWNEPNLYSFWDGTRSQYFELYRHTATVIKSIDTSLRVGGPATSNFVPDARFDGEREDEENQLTHQVEDLDSLEWHGVWIKEFLDYCAQQRLPVDFVSTHPYPTDFALDNHGTVRGRSRSVDALQKDLHWLKQAIADSAYPQAEIHLTEWSSSPSARDMTHEYLQEATFIVKSHLDVIGLCDSLSYWALSDVFEETGAGDTAFHGGFGLVNYQGIAKPGFHAYRMLSKLMDECLYQDDHTFITKGEKGIAGLLYHYPIRQTIGMSRYPDRTQAEQDLAQGSALPVDLVLTGLNPHQVLYLDMLDQQHGWAFDAWRQMGEPASPTRSQAQLLQEKAMATKKWTLCADENGQAHITLDLAPWSLLLITENP